MDRLIYDRREYSPSLIWLGNRPAPTLMRGAYSRSTSNIQALIDVIE
jgi:hypothetical protein